MKAAIFHGPNQPLTIEDIEIDKPMGREVLVHDRRQRRLPQRPALRRRPVPASRRRRCSATRRPASSRRSASR